jgi:hypothetical protein
MCMRSSVDCLSRRLNATRLMMVTTRNRDIRENLGEGQYVLSRVRSPLLTCAQGGVTLGPEQGEPGTDFIPPGTA